MEGLTHELANHPNPIYLENLLRVIKHIIQLWQAEGDWIKNIREQGLEQYAPPTNQKKKGDTK
jgi:hypothetical protein